ncbi:MAG: alpha-beta hydrolase superfamily lysophospholipase [Candidatus Azotimanducaceae bacterium]
MESFIYQSPADQWPIHAYSWSVAPARGTVVIAHGMAEHALRYKRLVNALNAAGLSVLAMDHRAHGLTSGPAGLGDFGKAGWDALVADLDPLVERAHAGGLPVIMLAHSMGAAAAQHYVTDHGAKLAALVLSGTTLRNPGQPMPDYNAAFESRTGYEWLSRDPTEVDFYVNDPLCGFEGQAVINGMDRTDPRRIDPARLARIPAELPVLLIAGDADPVNDSLQGLHYFVQCWRAAGVQSIDCHYYQDGRHEMFNEINRDEVTRDLLTWIEVIVFA